MTEQKDFRGKARKQYQTVNTEPSQTVQSDADGGDIQKIMARYKAVGIIENLNKIEATFQDVTSFTDFADVMRTAKEAEFEFMKLPSKVREIFEHDVAVWLDSAHDEEKRRALAEAGYIAPIEEPAEAGLPTAPAGTSDPGPSDPGNPPA